MSPTTRTKWDRLTYEDVVLLRWEEDTEFLVWDSVDDILVYWNLTDRLPREQI